MEDLDAKLEFAQCQIKELTDGITRASEKINKLAIDNDVKEREILGLRRDIAEQDRVLEEVYSNNGQLERGVLKLIRMIGESVEDE